MSLDAAGLIALADLTTVARRTALTGTSCLLDAFVLCPGLHRQQLAPELNGGEYPACGAMTTGYVFRVENPATVHFLQKVSRTAHLTTLVVSHEKDHRRLNRRLFELFFSSQAASLCSSIAYLATALMTLVTLVLLALSRNSWALGVFSILVLARLLNIVIIRRRAQPGWFGAKEPGIQGDLIILLSQDRWVRMRGPVDDLKAVTSGQWLREPTFIESSVTALATVLVYLDAALASNVDQTGKLIFLILLIASAGMLAIANETTDALQMHGRVIKVAEQSDRFDRRLQMVNWLIGEVGGRKDWAIRMGMIVPDVDEKTEEKAEMIVAM